MNLIPESNGFKRVNMKRKISHGGWVRRIFTLIVGIFIFGLVFQAITYFVGISSDEREEWTLVHTFF